MAAAADIPALVRRLRSGSRVAQLQAVKQLRDIAHDEAVCSALVGAGGVPPLLQLLTTSSSIEAQAAAVIILEAVIVTDVACANAVAAAGVIPTMVATLHHSSTNAVGAAASALGHLAQPGNDHKTAMLAAGAVEALARLLQGHHEDVQQAAVYALRRLADGSEQCRTAIAAADAIPTLVQLIPVLQEGAAGALLQLAWDSDSRSGAIAAAGAGPALEQLLLSDNSSEAAKEAAAAVLFQLAIHERGSAAFEAASAAVGGLVKSLAANHGSTASCSLCALGSLVHNRPASGAAMLAAGVLPMLGPSLQQADSVASAAFLLQNLAFVLPAEREAIGSAGVIPGLIGQLKQTGAAAWALRNLAVDCPANQQAILAAGGFEALLSVLQGSSSSSDDEALKGAAAVALCTLARGSQELMQAARAGGAMAAIQLALPLWQSDSSCGRVEAALDVLALLSPNGPADTPTRQDSGCTAGAAPRPPRVCAAPGCGATHGLRRCGGCGTVRYCSTECCRAHWRAHKSECRRLQAAKASAAAATEGQPAAAAAEGAADTSSDS